MTVPRVHLVGGLFEDNLETVTAAGIAALERSECIVFPGTWLGPRVLNALGPRLRFGRHLTVEDTLTALMGGDETALLYGGDPLLFTGRPDFPSALLLVEMLESRGASVVLHPGVSSVQWALAKAQLEVPAAGAPLLVSSYFANSACTAGFLAAHPADTFLVLLWFEDRISAVWEGLALSRGEDARACLVCGGATSETSVVRGTVGFLSTAFPTLAPPAVLLVEPVSRKAVAGHTVRPFLAPETEWAELAGRRVLSSNSSRLVWITGLPGSGKSTLLKAIQRLSPESRCLELADVVATIAPPGPASSGGAQRNMAAADFIRRVAALDPPDQRWFVASAALGAESVSSRPNESVYVIDARADVCRTRLAARGRRRQWSATPDDLPMYERIIASLLANPHVNVLDQTILTETHLHQAGTGR